MAICIITCLTPLYIFSIMGLHMLLLWHALIPCLAAYILHLFLNFWHCHPYILQHFNVVYRNPVLAVQLGRLAPLANYTDSLIVIS